MKKLFLFFVISIMILSTVGCSSSKSPEIPESNYKQLVIKDLFYDKNEKTINFETENKGNEDIITSLHYTIEKYNDENNKWEETNLTDNLVFIEIALIIEGNKSIDESIDLPMADNVENGYYRIAKEYSIGEKNIVQYIQFEYNDGKIDDLNAYN